MREITVNSDFTLPVRSEKQIASNVLKGSLGNLIEWLDWYVYASFAIYFSGAFFPAHNPTAQLLAAAEVFAIGFFMRPLGSLIMGRLADRHGRRTALTVSVLIMATGSLIIAFIPTYATIGIWSPLILIATRLLQGLSLGGEYGTSATYLSEMASPHHRGFYAFFQYVTLIAGQLFALLVQIILQNCYTNAQLTAFGWRIPFGIGAIGALVVLWLRLSMEESDQFTRHPAPFNTLPQADYHCDHDDLRRDDLFLYLYYVSTTIHDQFSRHGQTSDSTSRWTPLSSAHGSDYYGP